MLEAFLTRPDQVLTKTELAALLWPEEQHRDFDRAIHNLISKLRRTHPQASSWFETVRKAGYRFCIPVVPEAETRRNPDSIPAASEAAPMPGRATPLLPEISFPEIAPSAGVTSDGRSRGRLWAGSGLRWVWAGAFALLCLLAAGLTGWMRMHRPAPAPPAAVAPVTVGVLSLSGPGTDAATADTLRGALSDALAALPNIEVRAEHSLPAAAGASEADLQGTARGLKLDMLLGGSLQTTPSSFTLNLELIRGSDGVHVRSLHYGGRLATLGSVPSQVAEDLAPRLLSSDPGQGAQHLLGGTTSGAAYDLAFRANKLLGQRTRESVTEAASLYRQAIHLDSRFARAWEGDAESHLVLANFGEGADLAANFGIARQSAEHALALDPSDAAARSTLGLVLLQHDWNFAAAEREMRLAVSMAPGSAVHHLHLALLLADEGRFAEAFHSLDQATEVDPAWPVLHGTAMYVHILARSYDLALKDAEALTAMRPDWGRAHRHLGWALWYAGKHADAVHEWIVADEMEHRLQAAQSEREGLLLLNREGVRAYAEHRIAAQRNAGTASDDFVAAEWYAFAGDVTQTLCALDTMIQEHDPESLKIAFNPAYDFVRSDPRFRELREQVRVPGERGSSPVPTPHAAADRGPVPGGIRRTHARSAMS